MRSFSCLGGHNRLPRNEKSSASRPNLMPAHTVDQQHLCLQPFASTSQMGLGMLLVSIWWNRSLQISYFNSDFLQHRMCNCGGKHQPAVGLKPGQDANLP
eukprot:scaffold162_cov267-Chaetoceros_neogracile.AAC.42